MMEEILVEALDEGLVGDAVIAASLAEAQPGGAARGGLEVQKHEGGSIKHDVSCRSRASSNSSSAPTS